MDIETHWTLAYMTISNRWKEYHSGINFGEVGAITLGFFTEPNVKFEATITMSLPEVNYDRNEVGARHLSNG